MTPKLMAASKALDARIAAGEPCISTAGIMGHRMPTWNDAQIKRFRFREQLFIRRNVPAAEAEALADTLAFRDFDHDERRLCLECSNLQRGNTCFKKLPVMRVQLMRCHGFQWEKP